MAGIFGVLETAGRGLLVAQRGVGVAGHNIANVETPGYSRQRQELAAVTPQQHSTGHRGLGVEQITIQRVTDAFIQGQLTSQGSALGSAEAQARGLGALEQMLNEQAGNGLGGALNALYDAFGDLASASTPGAPTERTTVLSEAQAFVDQLHSVDAQMRDLMTNTSAQIETTVAEINGITEEIHGLNVQIVQQEIIAPANDLRDRRDQLVRDLANLTGIQSFESAEGALTVMLPGGQTLVDLHSARSLAAVPDPTHPFGASQVSVHYQTATLDADISADLGDGQLGGLLRTRDTTIPAAIRSLDTLAYNLAETVNSVHQTGVGLDGLAGDFFAPLPAVEDAARDLVLDARVTGQPDAIAAGLTAAPADNEVALQLADLRDAAAPLFLPGDPPGPATGPSRSVLDHAAAMIADVGQQSRTQQASVDVNTARLGALENRREEVSGVSIDEEVTKLVQLQAAYQANARVINVVQSLLDDLVNIL